MRFTHATIVCATYCILLFTFTAGLNSGTRFTKEPPPKLFFTADSDVKFHWTFAFGDEHDHSLFEEIIWGQTDSNKIRNKYLTVSSDEQVYHNKREALPSSFQSRLDVKGNITKTRANFVFILKDATSADTEITYGCTAIVYGEWFRSGPIKLVLAVHPSITIHTNALIFKKGEDAELQCDATGDPAPFVEWSKDGAVLQNSNETTSYAIPSISVMDEGKYVCTVTNPVGSVFSGLNVTVST